MATSPADSGGPGSILKLDIDALDQNKTRYPRNLQSSKQLSALWRPQVHLLGVVVWGEACLELTCPIWCQLNYHHAQHSLEAPTEVLEAFYVLEPDIKKDSSTEITCILRGLDAAAEILDKRGVALPEHLVIEAGRACQHVFSFPL